MASCPNPIAPTISSNEPKKRAYTKAAQEKARWTFPKNKLEDAVRLVQAIEEKNAGKPIRSDDLAKLLAFTSTSDWRFLDLLKSSNQYSLVTGSGRQATVALTQTGNDIVARSSPEQRHKALIEAFNSVERFKAVADFYAGKKIPDDEYFSNLLVRQFGVSRDRVEAFIGTFTANLQYLRGFVTNAQGDPVLSLQGEPTPTLPAEPKDESGLRVVGRQYLDTRKKRSSSLAQVRWLTTLLTKRRACMYVSRLKSPGSFPGAAVR